MLDVHCSYLVLEILSRSMGVFELQVLQWLRILNCIFSAYCTHRAILIKMAIFEVILLINSYEI
jgi:hypothetical protein